MAWQKEHLPPNIHIHLVLSIINDGRRFFFLFRFVFTLPCARSFDCVKDFSHGKSLFIAFLMFWARAHAVRGISRYHAADTHSAASDICNLTIGTALKMANIMVTTTTTTTRAAEAEQQQQKSRNRQLNQLLTFHTE